MIPGNKLRLLPKASLAEFAPVDAAPRAADLAVVPCRPAVHDREIIPGTLDMFARGRAGGPPLCAS